MNFTPDDRDTLVVEYWDDDARYCRSGSKNRFKLQEKLVEYYEFQKDSGYDAYVFPSGMSAIGCVFNILSTNIKIPDDPTMFIISDELYMDTPRICEYQKRYNKNFNFEKVDVRDNNKIFELFKKYNKDIKLFFVESCTNPSGQVFDFSLMAELKKLAPNCTFCVDNTWVTAYSFNPFKYGADVVVESMTKYISGGKCIGGMIVGKKNIMDEILMYSRRYGLFVGSDHCQLFLDGLDTMKHRVEYVSENAIIIANYLENNKKITRILYPKLISHPTYEMSNKYLKLNPGCMWFHIKTDLSVHDITNILSSVTYIYYETSFGSSHTKIDSFPKLGKSDKYDFVKNKDKDKINGVWIRLSIGHEINPDKAINSLEDIINKF